MVHRFMFNKVEFYFDLFLVEQAFSEIFIHVGRNFDFSKLGLLEDLYIVERDDSLVFSVSLGQLGSFSSKGVFYFDQDFANKRFISFVRRLIGVDLDEGFIRRFAGFINGWYFKTVSGDLEENSEFVDDLLTIPMAKILDE